MTETHVLLEGLSFGESPRWHDGRLWVCDWGAQRLLTVDADGTAQLVTEVHSFPFCIAWTPGKRLLINSAADRAVLALGDDGALVPYCDLSGLSANPPNNEIVVDGQGNAYVDGGGFDMMAGEPFAPGMIALVSPDGEARQVADDIHFGNGMAITPDNRTLIVAESYQGRLTAFDIQPGGGLANRHVWAEIEGSAPDGICIDAEGAVWFADVPNRHCLRVAQGGEILDEVAVDRGCFACALGGTDGTTLFVVAREWHGAQALQDGAGSGQVLTAAAPAPGAGWP
jgi:sugar lactone lactonase YvrE